MLKRWQHQSFSWTWLLIPLEHLVCNLGCGGGGGGGVDDGLCCLLVPISVRLFVCLGLFTWGLWRRISALTSFTCVRYQMQCLGHLRMLHLSKTQGNNIGGLERGHIEVSSTEENTKLKNVKASFGASLFFILLSNWFSTKKHSLLIIGKIISSLSCLWYLPHKWGWGI